MRRMKLFFYFWGFYSPKKNISVLCGEEKEEEKDSQCGFVKWVKFSISSAIETKTK